jgi:hypothetical protein
MNFFFKVETEEYGEIELAVEYDVTAGEPMQPNPDKQGFGPGCAAEYKITSITVRDDETLNYALEDAAREHCNSQ